MSEPNTCVDCGFDLNYSDDDLPICYRCDANEWESMYYKTMRRERDVRNKLTAVRETLTWIDSDKGDEAWKRFAAHQALAIIDGENK